MAASLTSSSSNEQGKKKVTNYKPLRAGTLVTRGLKNDYEPLPKWITPVVVRLLHHPRQHIHSCASDLSGGWQSRLRALPLRNAQRFPQTDASMLCNPQQLIYVARVRAVFAPVSRRTLVPE